MTQASQMSEEEYEALKTGYVNGSGFWPFVSGTIQAIGIAAYAVPWILAALAVMKIRETIDKVAGLRK